MAEQTRGAILGIILAGGQGRRMGGDKPLQELAGRPLLAHVAARLAPQVDAVILNANDDPARYAAFGLPVAADPVPDFAGPLAGILAGMDWARANRPETAALLSVPADAPFLPRDLAVRMMAARDRAGAEIACAASGGQLHPVVGLWPLALRDDLRHALIADGVRRMTDYTARHHMAQAAFGTDPVDPFFNVNTPADLAAAEALAAASV